LFLWHDGASIGRSKGDLCEFPNSFYLALADVIGADVRIARQAAQKYFADETHQNLLRRLG
jgi:hypothetical protein